VAVDAWKNAEFDNWNSFTDTDWQYAVQNSCGTSLARKGLPKSTAAEDLGNEADETEEFGQYARMTYYDTNPGTSANNLNSATSCTLDIAFYFQSTWVRP
jgi:hypothetical protein